MKKPRTIGWTDERIVALRKAYVLGFLPLETIATDFKCSKDTIYKIAQKYGWKRQLLIKGKKRITVTEPARVAAIKLAYEANEIPVIEIAASFRISTNTISGLVKECGWKRRPRIKFHKNNSYHKAAQITEDARTKQDDPEVLRAKKILQPHFVVFGKGPYIVGTHRLDRDALLEKARRYEAKGMGA